MSEELERYIRATVGAANNISLCNKITKRQWRDLLGWYRWKGKPMCPHCGCEKSYVLNDSRFRCANRYCNMKFSEMVGTVFAKSNLSIGSWMIGINVVLGNFYLPSNQFPKKKIASQKTGWFMLNRLKQYVNPQIKDVWMQLEYLSKVPFWNPSDEPELKESKRLIIQLNHLIYANNSGEAKRKTV